MVCPSPMASGRLSYAEASCPRETKRWRGTLPIASSTASAKTGRPVSPPVSRAIATISATMPARAAARASWAAAGGVWVAPIMTSAGTRKARMDDTVSRDHQAGEPLRIGEEVGAGTAVGDSTAIQDESVLRDLERKLRVLLDQNDRQRFLADEALQRLQQNFDDDRSEALEGLVQEKERGVAHERTSR